MIKKLKQSKELQKVYDDMSEIAIKQRKKDNSLKIKFKDLNIDEGLKTEIMKRCNVKPESVRTFDVWISFLVVGAQEHIDLEGQLYLADKAVREQCFNLSPKYSEEELFGGKLRQLYEELGVADELPSEPIPAYDWSFGLMLNYDRHIGAWEDDEEEDYED